MKRYYGVTTKCPECGVKYPEQDCGHQALELEVLRLENHILKNRETWALRAITWRMARVAELEADVQSLAGWEAKAQLAAFRIRELEAALRGLQDNPEDGTAWGNAAAALKGESVG